MEARLKENYLPAVFRSYLLDKLHVSPGLCNFNLMTETFVVRYEKTDTMQYLDSVSNCELTYNEPCTHPANVDSPIQACQLALYTLPFCFRCQKYGHIDSQCPTRNLLVEGA